MEILDVIVISIFMYVLIGGVCCCITRKWRQKWGFGDAQAFWLWFMLLIVMSIQKLCYKTTEGN